MGTWERIYYQSFAMGNVIGARFENTNSWTLAGTEQFADVVTRDSFQALDFLEDNIPEDVSAYTPEIFDKFTITSVGNIAYIALHSPSPYKERAQALFQAWLPYKTEAWIERQLLEQKILGRVAGPLKPDEFV